MSDDTGNYLVSQVSETHAFLDTLGIPQFADAANRLLARVKHLAALITGADLDSVVDDLKEIIDGLESDLYDGADEGDQAEDPADSDL